MKRTEASAANPIRSITFTGTGKNSGLVRFFMWWVFASLGLVMVSVIVRRWMLAIAGMALLAIGKLAGEHFSKAGLRDHEEHGLRCRKCGQLVDFDQVFKSPVPQDHIARCRYCNEPFGKISN
jgi:hypothetical protein